MADPKVPQRHAGRVKGQLFCGNCLEVNPTLPDHSVQLCFFSPPYANQRMGYYPSVTESNYPAWMLTVMRAIKSKLTKTGVVGIVIRTHIRHGVESSYVEETRRALRNDGWKLCEEIIWYKSDVFAGGSRGRDRRAWESVLIYSLTNAPYFNTTATGTYSTKTEKSHNAFNRSIKHWTVTQNRTHKSRMTDVWDVKVGKNEKYNPHSAQFPVALAEIAVRKFTRPGDLVFDPFCGLGATLVAARNLGRAWFGIDITPDFVTKAKKRLQRNLDPAGLKPELRGATSRRNYLRKVLKLPKSHCRLFDAILHHADYRYDWIDLSLTDAAKLTALSRMTIIRAMKRLQDGGWIDRRVLSRSIDKAKVRIASSFFEW